MTNEELELIKFFRDQNKNKIVFYNITGSGINGYFSQKAQRKSHKNAP